MDFREIDRIRAWGMRRTLQACVESALRWRAAFTFLSSPCFSCQGDGYRAGTTAALSSVLGAVRALMRVKVVIASFWTVVDDLWNWWDSFEIPPLGLKISSLLSLPKTYLIGFQSWKSENAKISWYVGRLRIKSRAWDEIWCYTWPILIYQLIFDAHPWIRGW